MHASQSEPRRLGETDISQLFLDARTHNGWLDRPVTDELLREIYELARCGPTSMNSQPMRVRFLKTSEAKSKTEAVSRAE